MKNFRGIEILKVNTTGHHGRNVKRNAFRVMLVEDNEVLAESFILESSFRILAEHVTFLQEHYYALPINGVLVLTPEKLKPLQSRFFPEPRNEMLRLLYDLAMFLTKEIVLVGEGK